MTGVSELSELNVAICGFGASASYFHLPLLRNEECLRLAAVFDPTPERRTLALEEGFQQALQPEELGSIVRNLPLHIVVVCSPNSLHYTQAKTALNAGAHVLVDKPLAANSQEVRELKEIAEIKCLTLMAFQNRRYDDDYTQALQAVGSGLLGDIIRIDLAITSWGVFNSYAAPEFRPGWRAERLYGGGVFYDWGPHLLDQLLGLARWEMPTRIHAIGRPSVWSADCEDIFTAVYEWPTFFARVLITTVDFIGAERLRVCGTKGTLVVRGTDESGEVNIHTPSGTKTFPYSTSRLAAAPIYHDLVEAVRTGRREQVNIRLRQTGKLFRLMDATREQFEPS